MLRRTKIVATLGPATDDPKVLDEVLAAKVDVVRLSLSHGNHEEHRRRAEVLRNRAQASGRQVGLMLDLQGPKIRMGAFRAGKVSLQEGQGFSLDADCAERDGDEHRVGISFKELPASVSRGDTLILADGLVVLWVEAVEGSRIDCRVVVGGELRDGQRIRRQGGGIGVAALTAKDREDIRFAAEIQADYLVVSFVRDAEDVREARSLLRSAGGEGGVIAKIERAEALGAIEEIVEVSDAILVARRGLGVEIGDAELPAVQKRLASLARTMNCVVITGTQMMQSMVDSAVPARADVFDVANAVLDGVDALILSEETAAGANASKAIETVSRICVGAEKHRDARVSERRLTATFEGVDEAIAMATMYTANHLQVKAIAALTESGSTVKWMSRVSSGIPIYALTPHVATRRKVTLYRGVYPVSFGDVGAESHALNEEVLDELLRRGAVRDGDRVILTKGDRAGVKGQTNTMKIIRVGDHPPSTGARE